MYYLCEIVIIWTKCAPFELFSIKLIIFEQKLIIFQRKICRQQTDSVMWNQKRLRNIQFTDGITTTDFKYFTYELLRMWRYIVDLLNQFNSIIHITTTATTTHYHYYIHICNLLKWSSLHCICNLNCSLSMWKCWHSITFRTKAEKMNESLFLSGKISI